MKNESKKSAKAKKGQVVKMGSAERLEQVRAVLELVEQGKSESGSCAEVGINRATFRAAALRVNAGDQYARALEGLAQDQAEKMELAIEDMRNGVIDSQMARVEIDARKWFASKFLPRRYGDRQVIAGDPDAPLHVVQIDTSKLSDSALKELLNVRRAATDGS